MNSACRWVLGLGVTGALASLAYFGIIQATLPPLSPPLPQKDLSLEVEEQRRARLDLYRAKFSRSMAIKRRVSEELIDGRITLFQAVVRFQQAEEGLPAAEARLHALRTTVPGNSDAERWCRKVISYIQGVWPESARVKRAALRLEQELERHLRRYGTVCLPVLPSGCEKGDTLHFRSYWTGNTECPLFRPSSAAESRTLI
jgi:hypothetical protein